VTVGLASVAFVVGALVSLGTSWVLVTRLERVGERLGLSEALLGLLAALAADTPEITAAVTALTHHQRSVGAGVVIGSNVFNLAALLGLGAVVAGRIGLHRKVVVLGGVVAMWVAVVCLVSVLGVVPPVVGLALVLVVLGSYVVVLAGHRTDLGHLPLPRRWVKWLASAVAEEELALLVAIRPPRGRPRDALAAAVALIVVVAASIAMERGASALGTHYAVAGIIVGGLVLAAVTSLPNAVAAAYLAAKGRGAATLSTALNSNTLNVVAGLLLPAAVIGLVKPSGQGTVVVGWYVGLTLLTLVLAYAGRGLARPGGWLIIAAYAGFVATLLAVA
jgi:cation:H+ antiporter